jgi:hypothetical protein
MLSPMNFPAAMPTSERLPKRLNGAPFSDEVLIFTGGKWFVGSYQFEDETGDSGSWEVSGEAIDAADVSHWMPLPPVPR